MQLPGKIQIQIVNKLGEINPLDNIFFGLKIFTDEGHWHNYSFFKTDLTGRVELSRQQIIDNAEINYPVNFSIGTPTEFQIYVWDGKLINDLMLATKRIADIYKDNNLLNQQLLKEGFSKEAIPGMIESFSIQPDNNTELYEYLKDVKNSSVQVYTTKIQDVWMDELPKSYQFIIESK